MRDVDALVVVGLDREVRVQRVAIANDRRRAEPTVELGQRDRLDERVVGGFGVVDAASERDQTAGSDSQHPPLHRNGGAIP